jgi:hypothetical protein
MGVKFGLSSKGRKIEIRVLRQPFRPKREKVTGQ